MKEFNKVNLAILPTPLQLMPNLTEVLGTGDLYIKRDDLTTVGLSGNKIRKLEYLLAEAKAQGATTLLTYGGAQTNHGRLTVAAATKAKMKSILILSGPEPEYFSGNLVLDKLMGADLYFTEGDKAEKAKEVIQAYQAAGEKVYEIPMGGSNELGALGYFYMVEELKAQFEEMGISPKFLIAGVGSVGTFAGLWLGIRHFGLDLELVPISVTPEAFFTEEEAADYINRTSEFLGLTQHCQKEELKWIYGDGEQSYAGIGYNQPDRQTQEAIRLLARTEAIFTDPCYSGKVFHGFVDTCKKHLSTEESAVFLHTGGVPGLWTKEHLDHMQTMLKE